MTYIDGVFEYETSVTVSLTQQKNYIYLQGGIQFRVGSFSGDIPNTIIYQLSDYLGSAGTRLDDTGGIIDKEEYYPYGDSSLRTFSSKRYRYIGKEKDEESGLYQMGARYYAPWTCKFISVDPKAANTSHESSYCYGDNNPIVLSDPSGMQTKAKGTHTANQNQVSTAATPYVPSGTTYSWSQASPTSTVGTNNAKSKPIQALSTTSYIPPTPKAPQSGGSATNTPAQTNGQKFIKGFGEGASHEATATKDFLLSPSGAATVGLAILAGIAATAAAPLIAAAGLATLGTMAIFAAADMVGKINTVGEKLSHGDYRGAGQSTGELTVDVGVVVATHKVATATGIGQGSPKSEPAKTSTTSVEPTTSESVSSTATKNAKPIDTHPNTPTKTATSPENSATSSSKTQAAVPKVGWKVGDPITKPVAEGVTPSWSTVRARFWKNEAFYHPEQYTADDLTRMRDGLAAQYFDPATGRMESYELHHNVVPQRDGGLFEFIKVTIEEHRRLDPFRR